MENYEIERKFLIKELPENLESYDYHLIEQGYLSTAPVVRVRKSDDEYYMTYKSKGFIQREEYNLPLTEASYYHLLAKADGNIISKKRYLIPFGKYTIELDVFSSPTKMVLAEVEFDSLEEANAFIPPAWFDKDVTGNPDYSNSVLSRKKF